MKRDQVLVAVPLDRLDELYWLLEDGKEIDAQARADLSRAVFFYRTELQTQIANQTPGGRFNMPTWELAFAAKTLVDTHGVPVKAAVAALLPRGNAAEVRRVARAYQKLAHDGGKRPRVIDVEMKTVEAALARLPKSPRKRTQSGNE